MEPSAAQALEVQIVVALITDCLNFREAHPLPPLVLHFLFPALSDCKLGNSFWEDLELDCRSLLAAHSWSFLQLVAFPFLYSLITPKLE